jgi:hypothetical protein
MIARAHERTGLTASGCLLIKRTPHCSSRAKGCLQQRKKSTSSAALAEMNQGAPRGKEAAGAVGPSRDSMEPWASGGREGGRGDRMKCGSINKKTCSSIIEKSEMSGAIEMEYCCCLGCCCC